MPEQVSVEFVGVDANLVSTVNKVDRALDSVSEASKETYSLSERLSVGMTGLNSAFALAERGLQYLKQGYEATVGETLEYANQVRQLSQISGESAENTSRFIQVLDDYKIGAEDAMAATRALTKQGLAPNIDTLAKLSDQYLKLNSVEDRNAFVIKNLGKSGLQWVEVLNKGSEAIRKQGDAVADGLILNQKQLDEARKLEMAQDTLNEGWQQVTMTVGNAAIPALTGVIDEFNNTGRAIEIMKEQGMSSGEIFLAMADSTTAYTDALRQATEETEEQRAAMLENNQVLEENEILLQQQLEQLKATTIENQTFISTLGSVGGAYQNYQQGIAEANKALESGEITIDEHKAKIGELASEYEETKNKVVLSMIQMKLAADGAFDDTDLRNYMQAGLELGVFTQGMVTATMRVYNEVDQMNESFTAVSAPIDQAGDQIFHTGERAVDTADDFGVMSESAYELSEAGYDAAGGVGATKSELQGMPPSGSAWEYFFNIITRGRVPSLPYNTTSTNAALETLREDTGGGRDSGGPGEAGKVYMIGRGAQPEAFVPSTNGTFVPNADKLLKDNSDVIEAIYATRIDERRLARSIVTAMAQAGVGRCCG